MCARIKGFGLVQILCIPKMNELLTSQIAQLSEVTIQVQPQNSRTVYCRFRYNYTENRNNHRVSLSRQTSGCTNSARQGSSDFIP